MIKHWHLNKKADLIYSNKEAVLVLGSSQVRVLNAT